MCYGVVIIVCCNVRVVFSLLSAYHREVSSFVRGDMTDPTEMGCAHPPAIR
jgi:hypothetical protein